MTLCLPTAHDDQCDHGQKAFHSTVHLFGEMGDLYFFFDKHMYGQWHYCFRTGPDGDYRSFPMEHMVRPTSYGESCTGKDIENWSNSRLKLIGYFLDFMDWRFTQLPKEHQV